MNLLEFSHVGLTMPQIKRRSGSGKSKRLRRFAGETKRHVITVVNDLSFEVGPGQAVALVGGRALARTSLLRLAAGTLTPDSGKVTRSEPIVPMIGIARALGRGYTVRQNLYLIGGLLGLTPDQVEQRIPQIIDFADLTQVLDRHLGAAPASTRQKLAWSIAMSLDSRFYVVDQTLVVGERDFRQKCWTHVDQLRERGATFIISSDNSKVYRRFCDRALYFNQGTLEADTTVAEALSLLRAARHAARESEE